MAKKNRKKIDEQSIVDLGLESEFESESESEGESENEVLATDGVALFSEALETELGDFAPALEQEASFLPEVDDSKLLAAETPLLVVTESVEGTELDAYESAEIEDVEFIEDEQLESIVESVLFASDRPVSLNQLKMVFKGTNIKGDKIRRALDRIAVELAGARRGVSLEEVPGGYQLRTKIDNMSFLTRTLKARPFRLSGPALEVLAIIAYKQPLIKSEIDEIRGVESGHLLRALMEKGLATFEGKSELPGKPMQYGTTKKFLEIFGLRNLKELPSISQIDELLPEGIGEENDREKSTLSQLTENLSQSAGLSYSEGEEELSKIADQLTDISTTSDFFEQEKIRQKQKRDQDKAQSIRDALIFGDVVSNRDKNWLGRFDEALKAGETAQFSQNEVSEVLPLINENEKLPISESESTETLFSEDHDDSVDSDMALAFADDEPNEQDSREQDSKEDGEPSNGPLGEAAI